jgi:hypothetical protein
MVGQSVVAQGINTVFPSHKSLAFLGSIRIRKVHFSVCPQSTAGWLKPLKNARRAADYGGCHTLLQTVHWGSITATTNACPSIPFQYLNVAHDKIHCNAKSRDHCLPAWYTLQGQSSYG